MKLVQLHHHLTENKVDLTQVWYRGTSKQKVDRISDHHGYGWYFISDIERAKKYGEIITRYTLSGGDIINGQMTPDQVGKILAHMKKKNVGVNIQHAFEDPNADLFDDPQEFYFWLVWRDFIGNKKTASEFLRDAGIDGMVVVNDVGDEILVVYNPAVMKEI